MDLDAVEPGSLGQLGAVRNCSTTPGSSLVSRARGATILVFPLVVEHLAFGGDSGRGHGQRAIVEVRMRDAADVPELGKDLAACGVHRLGNVPPTGELLGRLDAGRSDIANPLSSSLAIQAG